MHLTILLPSEIFMDKSDVLRIVVETVAGSWEFLPHRLDCVAAIVPGLLTFETRVEGEVFLAIDEGILVKTGQDVLISVRRAIGGVDLDKLHEAVEQENLNLNEEDRSMREVVAKLESGLARRLPGAHRV